MTLAIKTSLQDDSIAKVIFCW